MLTDNGRKRKPHGEIAGWSPKRTRESSIFGKHNHCTYVRSELCKRKWRLFVSIIESSSPA